MKKIAAVAAGCLMALNFAFAGDPTPADQKWLSAIEKKVAAGETKVSTPSKERLSLLKEWAVKKGYSVEVTESDANYRVKLARALAKQ